MKLETKLNVSTGVLVLAMLVSAASVHSQIRAILRNAVMVDGERQPFITELRDLREHVAGTVLEVQGELLDPSGEGERALDGGEARRQVEVELPSLLAKGRVLDRGPAQQDLTSLATRIGDLERAEEEARLLGERGSEGPAAARSLLSQQILPLDRAIGDAAGSIIESQDAIRQQELAALRDADRNILITLWSVTLLAALLGGTTSLMLARQMTRGINLIASRANSIASGDLTGAALSTGTGDQTGMLAEAMNGMQAALGGIIGTVADTAGSLIGSAASMRSASDHIHRRIDQQSQQTQQAATAMQEMSASIAEVSRHTQSAAETARSAAQTAREGGLIVKQMLGSMHSIATAVTDTSSTVGMLGEDSKRISQIVTVIDEIARKTNLLALNAAIEAARAGDQGRGFAVVAGEVRRLAESTAQATGEISTMIQEIQDRTRSAIASMAAGTGTVQEGVVTTTQAGEALERIIGMAERVDRMITQIAIAASQQAAAADQSAASLDSIHSLSHENLTEMATTAAGIESLRGTAVTLERQVDRFQVQSHPHRAAA